MKNNNKNRSGGRFNRYNRSNSNSITKNTVFDSSGPCGRLRGTASQLVEKYMAAAKDAKHNDRVLAEVLLQHADHYARLLAMASFNENANRPEPVTVEGVEEAVVEADEASPENEEETEEQPAEEPVSNGQAFKQVPSFLEVKIPEETKEKRRPMKKKLSISTGDETPAVAAE